MIGAMTMETDAPTEPPTTAGDMLRAWRGRRRMSQLDLALGAEISTRHLSFVETGRAAPSRQVLMRLAEELALPLRARNALLVAAGFAPVHPERPLDAPDMAPAREAIARILEAHEPYPALAIDRRWTLIAANRAVAPFLEGVDPALLQPPANVLRLSLHPDGLAPRIENLGEWRAHLLHRLGQQVDQTADPVLTELLAELSAYPSRAATGPVSPSSAIAVPLSVLGPDGTRLSFLSTTTVFGTSTDVTLEEIALECLFPADEATRRILQESAEARR